MTQILGKIPYIDCLGYFDQKTQRGLRGVLFLKPATSSRTLAKLGAFGFFMLF